MGLNEVRALKAAAGIPKPKKSYVIPKKSAKKIKMDMLAVGDENALNLWFADRRKEMKGFCQCGCGDKSQKKDDEYYRCCICHILPKRIFKSVAMHPLNWVERAFWGGCHSNMDNKSMDLWIGMEDWDDIKAKFEAMEPYLTKEEKATKFYSHLKELVQDN